VLLGDEVPLQEALGKQQKVNPCGVRPRGEVVDDTHRRVHVPEDLWCLARTHPHPIKLSGQARNRAIEAAITCADLAADSAFDTVAVKGVGPPPVVAVVRIVSVSLVRSDGRDWSGTLRGDREGRRSS
jgi:hypothetical protein